MTTEERLEKLEKELTCAKRRSRRLLVVVGLAAGALALAWIVAGMANTAQAQGGRVPTVIRANKFILEDQNGEPRAGLAVTKYGPGLSLFDENGEPRVMLCVGKDGPRLSLRDENGEPRVMLSVTTMLGPCLSLSDKNGKPRAALAVQKNVPGLVLLDENGKGSAVLSVGKVGPGLVLTDRNGRVIWQTP